MYPTRVLEKLHGFSAAAIETIVRLTATNMMFVGILMVIAGFVWQKSRKVVVLLVFLELLLFAQNGMVSIDDTEAMRFTMMRDRVADCTHPLSISRKTVWRF
jgi:uncharacterized membrane protein (Fun14 family)